MLAHEIMAKNTASQTVSCLAFLTQSCSTCQHLHRPLSPASPQRPSCPRSKSVAGSPVT